MGTRAEPLRAVVADHLDVGDGGGIGALPQGVLGIVGELEVVPSRLTQRALERVDRAVAAAGQLLRLALDLHGKEPVDERAVLRVAGECVVQKADRPVRLQVFTPEGVPYLRRVHLPAGAVGQRLDHLSDLGLHGLGELAAKLALHDVGHAALPGLGVDADDRLIGAADVGRVDRQVGDLPPPFALRGHALVDGILMGAGEGGEDQLAGIRMARAHRQLRAGVGDLDQAAQIAQLQAGVHALRVEVEGDRDDVDVTGALAVAEQGPFDALAAGQQSKLRGRHAGAAVVVGVQAEDDAVPALHAAQEPLDLVGVDVGGRQFDRGRQVDDHASLRARVPRLYDRVAHLDGKVELGAGKALRRVLVDHLGVGAAGQLADQAGAVDGDPADRGAVLVEHHPALQLGRRVVQVHDRLRRPLDRIERAPDQVVARLREDLRVDPFRDQPLVDQRAGEVELDGGSGGEPHFDLLEADVDQQGEHAELLLQVHRIDERLVAVAQVDAAPDRRAVDGPIRPGAVRQVDRRERPVLVDDASLHGSLLIHPWGFAQAKKNPGSSVDRIDRQAWAASRRFGTLHARYRVAPGNPGRKAQEVEKQIERFRQKLAHADTALYACARRRATPASGPGAR